MKVTLKPEDRKALTALTERNKRVQKTFCGASLRTGGKCKKGAGYSTRHVGWGLCADHGGNSPEANRNAALAESQYLQRTFASSVATDPTQALVDELARTNGAVQWLQLQIDKELIGVELEGEDPLDYLISARGQLIRKMYDQERDRLTRLSAACINLGLKERELKLAEQMGWLIQRVLEATLHDLHLTPEQRDAAKPLLAAHLQAAAHSVVEGQVVPGISSGTTPNR